MLHAGKVTSLVAKKDLPLATRIEEAIKKNESLEALTVNSVRRDASISRQIDQKYKTKVILTKNSSKVAKKTSSVRKLEASKKGKDSLPTKSSKGISLSKPVKSVVGGKRESTKGSKPRQTRKPGTAKPPTSKLSVVGFRGRSSSGKKAASRLT